jgi:predicted permease
MRELFRRAWYAIRQRRFESDLAEEIEYHRARTQEALEEQGLDQQRAATASRRALGNVLAARDRARDVWIWPWLQDAALDVRFAMRLFARQRGSTLAALTALALGLASGTVVFTIVNAMVLRGLPVEDPDRIVSFAHEGTGVVLNVSYREIEDWRGASRAFAGVAGYSGNAAIVGDGERSPEVFYGSYISADAFRLIGERPILGRDFTAADDVPGAPPVVLLGHTIWTTRYGGDPATVGRTIRVNNAPATVIGVMAEGFRFPLIDELWQPLGAMPRLDRERRDARVLRAFGRLADHVSLRQAQSELDAVAGRLAKEYPATNGATRPVVGPFTGKADHPMFLALSGAVAFVMLIACANVANLLLARSIRRAQEVSIRAALGATRWRIIRQALIESALLAVMAGLLGLALAAAGTRLFARAVSGIPFAYWYHERWTLDPRVFGFLAAACLAVAFVTGLVPALHLSKPDVNDALKDGSRTLGRGMTTRRWTGALLIAEMAFTLTLLAGAGLMMRSFLAVYRADAIVDASNVLSVSVRLTNEKYPTPEHRIAFLRRLEERFASVGPLSTSTIASTVPFIGAPMWQLAIDGRDPAPEARPPRVSFVTIGSRYFETLGLRLLRGRSFTASAGAPGHESAIVSQRFVELFFPTEDPIGRRIRLTNPNLPDTPSVAATIVGVSPTVRQQYMAEIDPVVYLPNRANPGTSAMLMIRSASDPNAVAPLVRDEVRQLDPDLPVHRVTPLATLMAQSRWGHRVFGGMIAVFAVIALVLAGVGLYAVTAYAVTQRTQEIGLRMALGARTVQVVWLFLRRVVRQLALGAAIGLAGAIAVGRLLRTMLVRTSPTDAATLLCVAALLGIVAVAACLWPSFRAARLDPTMALRHE